MNGLETTQAPSTPLPLFAGGPAQLQKADSAFRTISEVSVELDIPQHVLRFWETKFNQIRPVKRNGGRRYYRPEDIEIIRRIKTLLYKNGYTIRGVQRVLRRHGDSDHPESVMESMSRAAEPLPGAGLSTKQEDRPDDGDGIDCEPNAEGHDGIILDSDLNAKAPEDIPAIEGPTTAPAAASTRDGRLFTAAMARMQPLAHVTALPGVYPQIGSGTVPVPGPAVLPPKPAALREAAEKAAATGLSLAQPLPSRAAITVPAGRAQSTSAGALPAKSPKIDPVARRELEQLLAGLRQLRQDLAAIRQ